MSIRCMVEYVHGYSTVNIYMRFVLTARFQIVLAVSMGSTHVQWYKSDIPHLVGYVPKYPPQNNFAWRIYCHMSQEEPVVYQFLVDEDCLFITFKVVNCTTDVQAILIGLHC